MTDEIKEILFDENQLAKKVEMIAEEINSDYKGKQAVVVGILKGSVIFLSDLVRRLDIEGCQIDFMQVSSYGHGAVSSGNIEIKKDLSLDVTGKNVLIIEDILDTGNTLFYLKEYILKKNAESVKICTLFDKPCRRKKPIVPDYKGFEIEDLFIVGYGLDYDEKYRNLPYVGILNAEVYS